MADKTFANPKNRERALKMLKEVISVLDEYKIDYYLDFGTLLGAVREKGFIPWDDDMDISLVNEEDYQKMPQILKEIEKRFKYKTRLYTIQEAIDRSKNNPDKDIYFTNKNNYQIAKIKKKSIFGKDLAVLDIFFKYEDSNYTYWYATGMINRVDKSLLKTGFKYIDFYSLNCKIPISYDKYLSSIYGEWKKKSKEWTCYESFALK